MNTDLLCDQMIWSRKEQGIMYSNNKLSIITAATWASCYFYNTPSLQKLSIHRCTHPHSITSIHEHTCTHTHMHVCTHTHTHHGYMKRHTDWEYRSTHYNTKLYITHNQCNTCWSLLHYHFSPTNRQLAGATKISYPWIFVWIE